MPENEDRDSSAAGDIVARLSERIGAVHSHYISDDMQLLIDAKAELARLTALNGEMRRAAMNVVDCWGVGRLNITALGQFIDELRALLSRQE